MPRLTQRFVDSIGTVEARKAFWDDGLRGFGVRVTPPSRTNPVGTKSYVVKYRLRGARRAYWMRLGATSALSPKHARRLAGWALAEVAAGRNPRLACEAEAPEAETAFITLAEFAPIYMRDHARKEKKLTSAEGDQSNLDRFVLPALGDQPLEWPCPDSVDTFTVP